MNALCVRVWVLAEGCCRGPVQGLERGSPRFRATRSRETASSATWGARAPMGGVVADNPRFDGPANLPSGVQLNFSTPSANVCARQRVSCAGGASETFS